MTNDRKEQSDSAQREEQRRDELLRRLLRKPPQPRPERDRGEKSSKNGGKPASDNGRGE